VAGVTILFMILKSEAMLPLHPESGQHLVSRLHH